jgi:Delta7-sterol 5-desaturase
MEEVRLWLMCVGGALAVSVATFWGIGGAVHWRFYRRRRAQAAEWKLQPARWLSPALSRHAFWLGSGNILFGSLVGGSFVFHLARGGWSRVYFDAGRFGWAWLVLSPLAVLFLIDAGLYYSHRFLHHKAVFRHVHRWHHRYVAPTVFTTTAMHPLEFLIFMAMLMLPAFLLPIHAGVYAAVIAYTYLIGMLDHSGIRAAWRLPLHADNRFHDDHHVYFHCNYGHHTALWDRWHGTVRKPNRVYDEHTWGGDEETKGEPDVELSRAQ